MNKKEYKPVVYISKLGVYMESVTSNELKVLLRLIKDYAVDYNSNNLSKVVDLSSMGVSKILKKLEKTGIIKSKQLGRVTYYKPNYSNDYAKDFFSFIFRKEAEESVPRIKRWVNELKTLNKHAIIGLLFGSIIRKESFNDVDLLVVLNKKQNIHFDKKIDSLKDLNIKKIHVVKQSINDFKNNLKKEDKVVVNALKKSVVLFGHEKLIEVLSQCQ